jgi:hypothetical protein
MKEGRDFVNSLLGLFHGVDVGHVADVSEVHPAFIYRVEVDKIAQGHNVQTTQGQN